MTTTLTLIARALPNTPILAIAFNKRIAEEMAQRLPSNATSKTLNAVGHRAWADQIRKRLVLNKDKAYEALEEKIDAMVSASVQFAEESPWPEEIEMYRDVYVQEDYPYTMD